VQGKGVRMRTIAGTCLAVGIVSAALALMGPASASMPRPGTVDAHFGVKGTAVLPRSTHAPVAKYPPVASALAVAGGRIWAGGNQGDQHPDAPNLQDYVLRLTASGRIDSGFRSGRPYWGQAGNDVDIFPTADGGAYVLNVGAPDLDGGTAYVVTRLTKSGALDSTWGNDGHVDPVPGCPEFDGCELTGGEVLPSGALRLAGLFVDASAENPTAKPMIVGLTPAGHLDTSLGHEGRVVVDESLTGEAGSLDGDVFAGFDSSGRAYFLTGHEVVRSSAQGVLDTTYGVHGIAQIPLPTGTVMGDLATSYGASSVLQVSPSGEMYVGFQVQPSAQRGQPTATQKALVVHLRSNGAVDTGFGARGLATYAAHDGSGAISALRADGKSHLLLGLTYWDKTRYFHLILRVSANTGIANTTSFGDRGAVASPMYVSAIRRSSANAVLALGWPTVGRSNAPEGDSRLISYVD
jgi:uncharacterized delta-60 repeat protein